MKTAFIFLVDYKGKGFTLWSRFHRVSLT